MGEPGGCDGGNSSGDSKGGQDNSNIKTLSEGDIDPAVVAHMTADELKRFIDTGRTGRRNALPDVSQPDIASTSTAGVAEALESLSMKNDTGQSNSGAGS